MTSNNTIVELDFNSIKDSLKTYLKGQSKFNDYDFDGSNMSVLLDVLAFNTTNNAFYTNMSLSEMFLDTAQLRESVISHSKQLNYLPYSRKSSKAVVDITVITGDPEPDSLIIPLGTEFRTIVDGKAFIFTTDSPIVMVDNNDGTFTSSGVNIYEGKYISDFFIYNGLPAEKFILNSNKVDLSSLIVNIQNSVSDTTTKLWTKASSLLGLIPSDEKYFVGPVNDKKYELSFGDDITSKALDTGNIIEAKYRMSRTNESVGADSFKAVGDIQGYTDIAVVTTTVSTGGSEREAINSIKNNAPKHFQTQERAITNSDYETILTQQFPDIQTLSVYGGEELTPPQFGRVAIAIDMKDSDGISDVIKNDITSYLKVRAPISISPVIINPEFIFVLVRGKINYNVAITTDPPSTINAAAVGAITIYNNNEVNKFNASLKYSILTAIVDQSHVAITSSDLSYTPFIKIAPTDLSVEMPSTKYEFYNEIKQVVALSPTSNYSNFEAPVISTAFISNGQSVFIEDNGTSTLQLVTIDAAGSRAIVQSTIGSVDYVNGTVTIEPLKVDSFDGDGIKLFITPLNKDFKGSRNKILSIDTSAMKFNVLAVRE